MNKSFTEIVRDLAKNIFKDSDLKISKGYTWEEAEKIREKGEKEESFKYLNYLKAVIRDGSSAIDIKKSPIWIAMEKKKSKCLEWLLAKGIARAASRHNMKEVYKLNGILEGFKWYESEINRLIALREQAIGILNKILSQPQDEETLGIKKEKL